MTRPCCIEFSPINRWCDDVPPGDEQQCLDQGGKLGPPGTCCADPHPESVPCSGFNPCWHCDWEYGPTEQRFSCCFFDLGFHWLPSVVWDQCEACGGTPNTPEDECGIHRKPECIEAREDREAWPGTPRWTLDTIGTVVFGESKVTEEYPADWPRGYQYGLSTHLTRPGQPDVSGQACGHAVARVTMLDDGYCYDETCSQADPTNRDSHRRSYGLLRTMEQSDPQAGVEAGYQYDVTCIHLPWWTEATYRSHKAICLPEPI